MEAFIQKYQKNVTGVLNGWDRVRIRGIQRLLANVGGMMSYLAYMGVLLKDFGTFVERTCIQVRQASEQAAQRLDRPVRYLPSSATDKYQQAEDIARQDQIQEGLVCVFSCVEPCMAYEVRSDRATKTIRLQMTRRKCVHLHHRDLFQRPLVAGPTDGSSRTGLQTEGELLHVARRYFGHPNPDGSATAILLASLPADDGLSDPSTAKGDPQGLPDRVLLVDDRK